MSTVVLFILFIVYDILSGLSINNTNCSYLYVSHESFRYNGWYQYSKNEKRFGFHFWSYMPINMRLHNVQLVMYENKWHFYNWNNKDESYEYELSYSIPIGNSTWYSLKDGSSITLNIMCSNDKNDVSDTETTISPHQKQERISWLINDENCHDKPRVYVGLITSTQISQIQQYWIEPKLSNNTSNITISISGNHNQYEIGKHKITYAARNIDKDYFIMCQITLYIIGDVSEENIYKCNNLKNQNIGIIDLIVDENTFLVIDPKYKYETTNDAIQLSYITPEFINKQITCYININWANIGDMISYPLNKLTSNNNSIIWKVLIILCTVAIFILIGERIYFYHKIHKAKYQYVDNDAELSFSNVNEMDTPFDNATNENMKKIRSLSLSAAGSTYASSKINNRAMSMQINEIVPLSMDINNKKTRNRRYMSVPTNLMSDNAIKMLEKDRKNDEMETFLQHEWEMKNQIITPIIQ